MATFHMILKMSAVTLVYVILTYLVWFNTREKKITLDLKIAIGLFYGILSIMSTHFAIDYGDMLLNVRDLGPMCAGLFFDPASGIIAGLLGGIERYIVGTYFGIGEYTSVACSVSTCLAGFFAAFMRVFIFKDKKPSVTYAFFMGAVIEVFHMYVVFITHRNDMSMAFYVVRVCSAPMIIFSGLGLALTSAAIKKKLGETHSPFKALPPHEVPVSNRFQVWLFGVTVIVLSVNFGFSYAMETQAALQSAKVDLKTAGMDINKSVSWMQERGGNTENYSHHVGVSGTFVVLNDDGELIAGTQGDKYYNDEVRQLIDMHEENELFSANIYGDKALCMVYRSDEGLTIFAQIPEVEVYEARDVQSYETMLADILLLTVIYVLISLLVQNMVVDNLLRVNESLNRITEGDLEEKVNVYNSSEFASLSDDINLTVDVLKGYIDAAEKRMEQELTLAHTIQDSALPKNFTFAHKGFEVYATMEPARVVGGDFYDVFFVDADKIALVIADVSGKGIPAALLMMRSKTAIRGYAESGHEPRDVFDHVNKELCEGNDINMFVTAWMGIIDLGTGVMKCVNAGHEYPTLTYGDVFKIFKDKHRPPLGAMEDTVYEEYELKFEPGDVLYVYTDGVAEAMNGTNEQYGTGRLLGILSANRNETMSDLLADVKADVDIFVGEAEQFDDITMMGFRYNGLKEARPTIKNDEGGTLMIKDWEVKPLGRVGTYREGKVRFDLFDMEIPVNLFEKEVTEEYAEKCAEAMNSMSPELIDRICRAAKLYCITFCDDIGEDLSDEMTVPITEDTPASEVMKCIRPVGLCVDTPRDPSKIGYQIEFNCDWEIEHGMEVDILDGELVYLSAYNGEGPWDGPYEEDWNYVNGI